MLALLTPVVGDSSSCEEQPVQAAALLQHTGPAHHGGADPEAGNGTRVSEDEEFAHHSSIELVEEREDESEEEGTEIFDCRRRRRRRRRQTNTLNKKCWYQMWSDSMYEGAWLNYEMGDNLCDDLSAYNSGYYDNKLSSGLQGATPGCKIMYYDSTDCSGSAMYTVDATSSAVAVTVNKNNFDSMSDKISSIYCTCP